jgi:AcrR family transcriptional regulator
MDPLVSASTSLRDDQRAATRQRIVRAVSALVADEHPATISVPAVARRAGVGVATVYRYFPTKELLLDAAAHEVVTPGAARLPADFDQLGPSLAAAWSELEEQLPLVRGQFASPVGRELHRRRWKGKHKAMAAALAADGIDPDGAAGRRLLGVADVLTSSTALLELRDKAGVPVDDAAAWCTWAVGVLHAATKRASR